MRMLLSHSVAWILQDKHKSKAIQLREDVGKAFTEHPEMTGESYLQHLWFTVRMAGRFFYNCITIFVHGLFPFTFTRTTSNQIEQIYRIMKTRIPKKRREEIDREIRLPVRIRTEEGKARVAIVGGGFSGTLSLVNLIEQSGRGLAIEWFERRPVLGEGLAYGTKNAVHLLNVRADRMGAFAGKPDHFYQWLQSKEGKMHAEGIWPGHVVKEDSFVPRLLYAEYLQDVLQKSLQKAKDKGIQVRIHRATITDADLQDEESQQIVLRMEQGGLHKEVVVNAVVLATGNLPPRSFHFQTGLMVGEQNYVEDVWNLPKDHVFPARVQELPADSDIVVIGTGLTMVDTVLTLKSHGYKGTITAISRNGLLPAVHGQAGKAYPAWEWVLATKFAPRTALGLFSRLRKEIRKAESEGYDWRSVVDSIRPVTPVLWKRLNTREKRKFVARLFTLWNIHRHRMAPEICQDIKGMQQSGSLKIIAGKIYYVGSDKEGITLAYRKRGTNRIETLRPTLVLNCTGNEYDIDSSSHSLLRNLRDKELVTVGPLRIGIEMTEQGTAKGRASEAVFPIGTLLVGDQLECTAVPELREQAHHVAQKVLQRLVTLFDEDYAAKPIMGQAI